MRTQFTETLRATVGYLRNRLLTGILVAVPLIITFYVLRFFYNLVDGLSAPLLGKILGYRIPGVGFVVTVVLLLLLGSLVSNFFGRRLMKLVDWVLLKLPFVRTIYGASKKLVEAVGSVDKMNLKKVVYIPYPVGQGRLVGFVTGQFWDTTRQQTVYNVFIPTTPNPTTGILLVLPEDGLIDSGLPLEDGLKLVISGGLMTPFDQSATPSHKN